MTVRRPSQQDILRNYLRLQAFWLVRMPETPEERRVRLAEAHRLYSKQNKWESRWVERQKSLQSRGYMLRPRYRPEWVPSWQGLDEHPMYFEDSIKIPVSDSCDRKQKRSLSSPIGCSCVSTSLTLRGLVTGSSYTSRESRRGIKNPRLLQCSRLQIYLTTRLTTACLSWTCSRTKTMLQCRTWLCHCYALSMTRHLRLCGTYWILRPSYWRSVRVATVVLAVTFSSGLGVSAQARRCSSVTRLASCYRSQQALTIL